MRYDEENRTFDCEATLTDAQVLQFCRDGFLLLKGVVSQETNERTCAWLDGDLPPNPSYIPAGRTAANLEAMRTTNEPTAIMLEDWFTHGVLLNRELGGALRSLLGRNVGLPVLISQHRVECPGEAQGWHYDADHVIGPEVNYLEVFYFPQDTPEELGPTEVVAGSHLWPISRDVSEPGLPLAGPAGTIGIHMQSIIHRKGPSTATGVRRMLKYSYWRTVPPQRDWIVEPDFEFETAAYGGHRVARYVAHMMFWLAGRGDDFRTIGGQAWPCKSVNQIGKSYGYGATSGYLPNWRRPSHDDYAL